jgi:hypothetical protein
MTKFIALVVAGMFAAGTLFAGEHGECTKKVGNEAKPACTVSLASLSLTPEQKTKMDAVMEEHHKAGCSEASENHPDERAVRQIQGGVQRRERQSQDRNIIVVAASLCRGVCRTRRQSAVATES